MITPTKTLVIATLTSVMALTAGCSSDMSGAGRDSTSSRIDSVEAQVNQDGALLSRIQDTGRPSNVKVRGGIYLGQDGFRTGRGDPLPRRLQGPKGVSLRMGDEMTLVDLVPALQRATGLRVDIRDLDTLSGGSDGGGASNGSTADSAAPDAAASTAGAAQGSGGANPADIMFRVDYEGSLSGFLDYVANQAGVDWEYKGGRIKFLGPQTVTYTIWALPGSITASGSVGGSGDEMFGSGNPPSASYELSSNYWEDIESGLNAIVPTSGAKFAVNRSSGSITLTSFQAVHERVQDFVEEENARLSRQVAVKIDVLAFTGNDSDTRSANINAVFQQLSAGLDFSLQNTSDAMIGAPGFGMTVLDSADDTLGKLSGSNALLQALAKKGKVSVLNSTSVIASNNTPTPVSMVSEKAYLAGTTTTENEDGTESTQLETGVINDGISMTLTPRILSGGDVMMNYHMTMTELVGMEEVSTADAMVQLPETRNRTFMQTVTIDSGDAMVVAAHDSNTSSRESYGPFSPAFWGLGGQDAYSQENTKIVILMTPVIVEGPNKPNGRR